MPRKSGKPEAVEFLETGIRTKPSVLISLKGTRNTRNAYIPCSGAEGRRVGVG